MAGGVRPVQEKLLHSMVQELGPKAALQQLALPLAGDTAAERAQGLRQVHSIVCGQDAMLSSTGVQLLQEARAHMTAAEQVGLGQEDVRTVPLPAVRTGGLMPAGSHAV